MQEDRQVSTVVSSALDTFGSLFHMSLDTPVLCQLLETPQACGSSTGSPVPHPQPEQSGSISSS